MEYPGYLNKTEFEVWRNFIYSQNMKLQIRKNHPDAKLPIRGTEFAAGYDLYSVTPGSVPARGRSIVDTGISVGMSELGNVCGMICSRSGLSVKCGLEKGAGLIDSDYTGPLRVVLYNHSDVDYVYSKHERIAQLVLVPILTPELEEVDHLTETIRGDGGFGSTGLH